MSCGTVEATSEFYFEWIVHGNSGINLWKIFDRISRLRHLYKKKRISKANATDYCEFCENNCRNVLLLGAELY